MCRECSQPLPQSNQPAQRYCSQKCKKRAKDRRRHYVKRYKIQEHVVKEMALTQNFRCAICFKKKALLVDHCHKTGRVRGLLCSGCNIALGGYEKIIREEGFRDYL